MTALVPTIVDPSVPRDFTEPLAYGDMATGILALASIAALRLAWPGAFALVWITNLVGLADLANAFIAGLRLDVTHADIGALWFIPTFVVPWLLVTHAMMLLLLVRRRA